MTQAFTIDHVVVRVANLAAAVEDYTALGFTVVPGGEHTGGATRNALISFADDSYLELIAFTREVPIDAASALERRFLRGGIHVEGLVDFALLPPDIERDLARTREHGLAVDGPLPGGRMRPDGQSIAWQLGIPLTSDLPFLCSDLTPRHLRVPGGSARKHANGAVGVAAVDVLVRSLSTSKARYEELLQSLPDPLSGVASGSQSTAFVLNSTSVALIAAEGERLLHELERRGEGPIRLRLRTDRTPGRLDPDRTHGATIEMVPNRDEFRSHSPDPAPRTEAAEADAEP